MSKPKHVAPLATASNLFDTLAKYVRVMERAGVSFAQFTLPINDRGARFNLAAFLKAGCPKLNIPTNGTVPLTDLTGYERAAAILGQDLITPEEIASARLGIVYTEAQLEEFEKTLPSREELEWLHRNGFMLVAGPPKPLSLLEIRDLKTGYFRSVVGGWYSKEKELFSRNNKVTTKWLKLCKEPVPNSILREWTEQQSLLSELEYIPSISEMAWGVTSYMAVRGLYLLPNVWLRTLSFDAAGAPVLIGDFNVRGLTIKVDNDVHTHYGLASARK